MGVVVEKDDPTGDLGAVHSLVAQKYERDNYSVQFSNAF